MARVGSLALMLVFASCFFAASGYAEEPEPPPALTELKALDVEETKILRKMLASGDARTVAWGAYEAGRRRARDVAPELIALTTKQKLADGSRMDPHVRRAVRAALVDVDAKVPRKLLLRLLSERGFAADAAVILAVRRGSDEDLLAMWDALEPRYKPADHEVALGNALAERETAGFARRLLSLLEQHLHLVVRSDDRQGYYGRPGSGVPGDGGWDVPAGYPPTVLQRVMSRGRVVLADGVNPMYHVRIEWSERTVRYGVVMISGTWQACYRDWLGMMLRRFSWHKLGESPPLDATFTLRWSTAKAFRRWVREQYVAAHERLWDLARRLIERKVLTRAEVAQVRPKVLIDLRDERDPGGEPLPTPELTPPPNPFGARK